MFPRKGLAYQATSGVAAIRRRVSSYEPKDQPVRAELDDNRRSLALR